MYTTSLDIGDLHLSIKRWFPVRTGFRKEKVAARMLSAKGVKVCLPLRQTEHHYASKSVKRELPLLSGYLFVSVCQGDINKVLETDHVYGFVKIGRLYKQVTETELDRLRYLCDDTSTKVKELAEEEMPPTGALLEIRRGPLAGIRGHLVAHKRNNVFLIALGGLETRLAIFEINADNLFSLNKPVSASL